MSNFDPYNLNFYAKIVEKYSEPHRKYHNVKHISQCLDELFLIEDELFEYQENNLEIAILFHDVIYNTKEHDNEEKSAEFAERELRKSRFPENSIKDIKRLILATKHNYIPKEDDEKIITDIDLSILGKPKKTFEKYEEAIREEYSWVPEKLFREGRAKILQSFLDRKNIYQTPFFRKKYESQAKKNLEDSIKKLENK